MTGLIRGATEADRAAIHEICYLTYEKSHDPRYRILSALRWAEPYLRYEMGNVLVSEKPKGRITGYILSAPDADSFRRLFRIRMKHDILKELNARRTEFTLQEYFGERYLMTRYREYLPRRIRRTYPAHLHINVHPACQGEGVGTLLMNGLLDHLSSIGCPGVHLGVGSRNTAAIRFYERYGFTRLYSRPSIIFYGYTLK